MAGNILIVSVILLIFLGFANNKRLPPGPQRTYDDFIARLQVRQDDYRRRVETMPKEQRQAHQANVVITLALVIAALVGFANRCGP